MSGKQYEPTYEGQLDKCQDERHALQMQLEEYQEALEFVRKEFHEALDDLAKMKEERNEARRRICETTDMTNPSDDCYVRLTPQQIADHYGWDCYKQENDK